jgi:hypothetical protein
MLQLPGILAQVKQERQGSRLCLQEEQQMQHKRKQQEPTLQNVFFWQNSGGLILMPDASFSPRQTPNLSIRLTRINCQRPTNQLISKGFERQRF